MKAPARVTVVAVTYRSGATVEGFLAALPPGVALVVVDNASGDGTADRVAALAPAARVVRNAANLGFGAGCNAGLACVGTEFALLLNPDARLAPGALGALVAAADRFPDAAILGPAIRAPDGRLVRSYNAGHAPRDFSAQARGRALARGAGLHGFRLGRGDAGAARRRAALRRGAVPLLRG